MEFLRDTKSHGIPQGQRAEPCSGPALTQTAPHRHPAKLRLLTLQDIPASCANLPLLRKTVGNLILLSAVLFVLKKRYCQPQSTKPLQMLYIAQQSRAWDNEHCFMLQDFQECPNLQSTSISKGEQSRKSPAEQVRACPQKMQRDFFQGKYKEQHRARVSVPAAGVCTHTEETLS